MFQEVGILWKWCSKITIQRLEGFFACTVQDPERDQRFVLGTRGEFSLIEPSILQFSYYMAGIRFQKKYFKCQIQYF